MKVDSQYFPKTSKHFIIYPSRKARMNIPKLFWGFDTEDDSQGNVTLAVLKSNNGQKFVFQNKNSMQLQSDFKNCIIQNKILLVYAHNLTYDLGNIFNKSFVNYEPVFRNGSVLQIKFIKCYFKDSVSILKSSIKDIGEEVGLPKLDPDASGRDIDLKYCERDVDILILALTKFFKVLKENKIPLKLTLASIYYSYFRTKLSKPILKSDYIEFVRYAYKGGRVEAFRIGKVEDVKVFDINALFPYVMLNFKMPEPKKCFRSNKLIDPEEAFQILNCVIRQKSYIPALGVKHNGKLMFMNGYINGFFTNEEIDYLVKGNFGELVKIHTSLVFDWKGKIFSETIQELYNLRMLYKNSYASTIIKFIMNGGYGKFAQSNMTEKYDENLELIVQVEKDYPAQSNYIWPIVITSNARMILHRHMILFSKELIYVDTDSLHLTKCKKFITLGNEIGDWKSEGNFKLGEYKNAKCYALTDNEGNTTYKVKGVPKKYQKDFFELGKATFKKPVKIKTHLHNPEHILNYWENVSKEMKSEYDKREVLPDGSTFPIELNYINDREQQLKEYQQKQANQMSFNLMKGVPSIRNQCYCGQFISDHVHFCETHNPDNNPF